MEIKKGISQMAEYPNVEINYVVPADGKMYYVLKNGELKNGCIIATLDPKKAIDNGIYSDSIGVFNADGSTLIDFNKKEIKNINDEFVLAVNAIPTSDDVVNALKNESDEISKAMLKNSSTTIVDKMMIEMGITGELLFSDAYSEANIYKLDSANHKIGPDSSFIGKNDSNFYFHLNDVTKETVIFDLDGNPRKEVSSENTGFKMPEKAVVNQNTDEKETKTIDDTELKTDDKAVEETIPVVETEVSPETDNLELSKDDDSLKLNISQNILDGFNPIMNEQKIETTEEQTDDQVSLNNNLDIETDEINEQNDGSFKPSEEKVTTESDEVLDSVIEVMKKMIEETNKLNERISELEEELKNKNNIIAAQESKKTELSNLLDEANEVLDNID